MANQSKEVRSVVTGIAGVLACTGSMEVDKDQSSRSVLAVAKKCVITAFFLMFLTFFALGILVEAYYHDYRPAEPQPAQGRIHATRLSKGVWVYLTQKEKVVYELLMPLSIASVFMSLLINTLWKQFPSQKRVKSRSSSRHIGKDRP